MKTYPNYSFVFILFFGSVFFLEGCKKATTGKINYPTSLIIGDSAHNHFTLQDNLSTSTVPESSDSGSSSYNIDKVGADDLAISVTNQSSQPNFMSSVNLNLFENVSILTNGNGEPAILNESDIITQYDSNWQEGNFILSNGFNGVNNSTWSDQQEKYIGVKIGSSQLGWIKLSVITASPGGTFQYVEVHEIAAFN